MSHYISNAERVMLLTNPRVTVGLPVSLFLSFAIRGCPDPLSESLSYHRYVYDNHPFMRVDSETLIIFMA